VASLPLGNQAALAAPGRLVDAPSSCRPVIKHVTAFPPGPDPEVTITGTCFGTGGAFLGRDSAHFRVTDLGPHGTIDQLLKIEKGELPQTGWSACASIIDNINQNNSDVVTCNVPVWTNGAITFRSFGPAYGSDDWVVRPGDKVILQVWNANTSAGPSLYLLTVGGGGHPSTPAPSCAMSLKGVSAFHAGLGPHFTVTGTCFGTGPSFVGDSQYFRVSDLGPHGTLSEITDVVPGSGQSWWNACSSRTDAVNGGAANGVGCAVYWSPTSITLKSFTTDYGGEFLVKAGDKIAVQIWDSNTLQGPIELLVTATS
jgi:hypothetical protein